jgi:hypothetical protein
MRRSSQLLQDLFRTISRDEFYLTKLMQDAMNHCVSVRYTLDRSSSS